MKRFKVGDKVLVNPEIEVVRTHLENSTYITFNSIMKNLALNKTVLEITGFSWGGYDYIASHMFHYLDEWLIPYKKISNKLVMLP